MTKGGPPNDPRRFGLWRLLRDVDDARRDILGELFLDLDADQAAARINEAALLAKAARLQDLALELKVAILRAPPAPEGR